MFTTAVFLALGLSLCAGDSHHIHNNHNTVTDFEDTYHNYTIIFHREYHLLLAIYEDKCYFVDVPKNQEQYLDDTYNSHTHFSRLEATEHSLLAHIQSGQGVEASTLQDMRDEYNDLLADFHCLDKHIFEVNFRFDGDHHEPAEPPADDRHFSCQGRNNGLYKDPTNCHKFYLCVSEWYFHETCPHGTAFSEDDETCEDAAQVDACHHDHH